MAKEIKDGQQRKYWKFRLTRMLYERGYEKQDIIDLYCFIDWLLVLPEDLEEEFVRELCEFEKEKIMQYVSSIERIGFKKGKQQGVQHGIHARYAARYAAGRINNAVSAAGKKVRQS